MNKSQILREYNIVKQLTAKELVVYAQTYKDNNNTIIVMMKKKPKNPDDKMPSWFRKWNKEVFEKVIKLNNLKTN